jgi:hypothetical protein
MGNIESDAYALRFKLKSEHSANEAIQFELGDAQTCAKSPEKALKVITGNAANCFSTSKTLVNSAASLQGRLLWRQEIRSFKVSTKEHKRMFTLNNGKKCNRTTEG